MKNLFYSIILISVLSACGGKTNEARITGEISGIESDIIQIYGADELSDMIDTLHITDGKIEHIIPVDTLLQVMMLLDNKIEYPLYLDKGSKINIKGDPANGYLDVKGVSANEQLTGFYKSIEAVRHIPDSVMDAADRFIRENQTSLVSVYLLDKHFIQHPEPDLPRIRELISFMDGTLLDKPYVENISAFLEDAEKTEPGKVALTFTMKNSEGENVTRAKFRNKYLLMNFWASWSDSCRTTNAELLELYRKYEKNDKLAILGISLDLDKNHWLEAIEKDTIGWEQVCDFTGPDNPVAKQYAVRSVPYNILLGTDGRVLERNIHGEALTAKLEELLKEKDKK